MQKKFKTIIFLGILLFYNISSASNIMQINSAQVQANQQVTIQVAVLNSSSFVAFQLDIPIPTAFTYIANSAALNPARSNGHIINATLLSGNILRIIGFSFNNSAFIGNTGTVASFNLKASSAPGDYMLIPTNPVIGNSSSVNILNGTANGTLTLLAPNINLNTNSLDFGQTAIGNTTDRYLLLTNTGNQNLLISNITINSPYFTIIGNTAFSIPPNGNETVLVRFISIVKGNYQKTMTITSNDPDQSSATVMLQAIGFTINEVHCGSMFAFSGTQASLSLSINNMEAFTGFQFDIQLPSALTYQQGSIQLTNRKANHIVSANVLPGNILRIVAFSSSNQSFSGNYGDIVTMDFMVNGNGGWYSLTLDNVIIGNSVGQNIVSAFYNNYLEIAAADLVCQGSMIYGDVSVFDTLLQYIRIYNNGNDTLDISQIQFTNTAFFTDILLPIRINQWEYADIPVRFYAAIEGHATGSMKIYSNDPDENPKIINLTANGIIPNIFSVMNGSCFKTDTVTVQLSAENHEAFVGFQFDISFPASMSYIQNSALLGNRSQGHIIQTALISPDTLRVFAFSMQQLPFTGSTGALLSLKFAVNASANETTLPLTLSNVIMGNNQGQNILYQAQNGFIQLIENKTLKLNLLLEGLQSNSNQMNNALNENGEPQWSASVADKVNLEIRNPAYPYTVIESISANLLTNGELITEINPQNSGQYYIAVKHRNHLETWSSSPVSFAGDTVSYNFTIAAAQAFADNQKEVATGIFAIMVGDINQDGVVDLSDLVYMDYDLTNGTVAYVVTDLNGDGVVDLSDLVTIDENITNGAVVMTP
jgi:hypothetical protein